MNQELFYPLTTKKFFVSEFSQTLYKNPPRCANKPTYIRFLKYVTVTNFFEFLYFHFFTVYQFNSLSFRLFRFFTAESLSLDELESVGIFEISRSVLKILAKQF